LYHHTSPVNDVLRDFPLLPDVCAFQEYWHWHGSIEEGSGGKCWDVDIRGQSSGTNKPLTMCRGNALAATLAQVA